MNVPGMSSANPKRTRALLGIALLVAVVGLAGAGIPVATLLYRTFTATSRGEASSVVIRAGMTSVALAGAAALVAVALAVPVATLAVRFRSRFGFHF